MSRYAHHMQREPASGVAHHPVSRRRGESGGRHLKRAHAACDARNGTSSTGRSTGARVKTCDPSLKVRTFRNVPSWRARVVGGRFVLLALFVYILLRPVIGLGHELAIWIVAAGLHAFAS